MRRRIPFILAGIAVLVIACSGSDDAGPDAGDEGAVFASVPESAPGPSVEPAPDEAPDRSDPASGDDDGDVQACADVIDGSITPAGAGAYRIDATVASGDTGWDKYADVWEVRTPDGVVLGIRELAHPHETEQPFTRSLSSVEIPDDVARIVLHANDSVNGFCGAAFEIDVPR